MTQAPPGPVAEPRAPGRQEQIPLRTRLTMFLRLLAIQSSWNYEILLGNGVGFCVEPALRRLPGGRGGVGLLQPQQMVRVPPLTGADEPGGGDTDGVQLAVQLALPEGEEAAQRFVRSP